MARASRKFALLSCLLATGMGYYYFTMFLPYGQAKLETANLNNGYRYGCDLYPLWLTSHQLLQPGENPYTAETTKQIQVALYGRPLSRPGDPPFNYRAFAYPIYADFLTLPLAPLSFPMVQAIGAILFPLSVICSCWLWLRFLNLSLAPADLLTFLALTLFSYPVLEGLYALQPSLIVSLLLATAASAMARNRLVLAGVLLGIASIKPHLIVIPVLWLVMWAGADLDRRRGFLFSLLATLIVLFSASQLLLPGWLPSWIHSMTDYRQYTDPPLAQFAFGTILGNIFAVGLLSLAALLAFRARKADSTSFQFALTFCYLLAVTVLVFPSSVAVYDHILLLPAIVTLLSRRTIVFSGTVPLRALGVATAAAFSWQWFASAGMTLYSLLSIKLSSHWMTLPVRMAASFPFAVVALWLFLLWKGNLRDPAKPAKSPARSG
jgi:hypothetical protein